MANLEIERRYLFNSCNVAKLLRYEGISYIISKMEQFYLKATSEETLRFRKENSTYIKNIKKGSGLVREEEESEVSKKEYKKAKALNLGGVIKKERIKFIIDGNRFELDIFKGKLEGMSILEIEFSSLKDAQKFKMPNLLAPYVIKEITNEPIYTNGALSKSMQIPLRDDSFISLKEALESNRVIEPKFDLYISSYEDTSLAFSNYLQRFFATFELNYSAFLDSLEIDYLNRAIESLKRVKSLVIGFRKYIKKDNYIEILFNINNFLLASNRVSKLENSFKELLKIKHTFKDSKQNDILKTLIKLAQDLKIEKDIMPTKYSEQFIIKLELSLSTLEFKKRAKIPFIYAKTLILKKELKSLKRVYNSSKRDTEVYSNIKHIKYLAKFFNTKVDIASFNDIKKRNRYKQAIDTIQLVDIKTSLKSLIISTFNGEINNSKKKPSLKIFKKIICGGN